MKRQSAGGARYGDVCGGCACVWNGMLTFMFAPQCRVLLAARAVLTPRWRVDLASPFWRLYHHDRDGVSVQIPGRGTALRLPGGRSALIPAGCTAVATCTGTVRQTYVHFVPLGLDEAVPPERWRGPLVLRPSAWRDAVLADLACESAIAATPAARLRLLAVLHHALAEVVEPFGGTVAAGADTGLVEVARRWVENQPQRPPTLAALARAAGLSVRHYRQRFTAAQGAGPAEYIRRRRIMAAAERLLVGDESIEAVAAAHGFANRHHFTRIFARVIGVPPARFRRDGRG